MHFDKGETMEEFAARIGAELRRKEQLEVEVATLRSVLRGFQGGFNASGEILLEAVEMDDPKEFYLSFSYVRNTRYPELFSGGASLAGRHGYRVSDILALSDCRFGGSEWKPFT